MNVDLDAIAQRGHCEVSSLRLALPLIEQGYTPPFLARYRRDELGGLDEPSLWALSHAVRSQQRLDVYRDELHAAWQATQLADPALGRAISGAKSRRLLDRLSRRVKSESGESGSLTQRLAVRLLSPEKGDGDDVEAIAASLLEAAEPVATEPVTTEPAVVENASENASEPSPETPGETVAEASAEPTSAETTSAEIPAETVSEAAPPNPVAAAVSKLDDALAKRLSGDPRILGAAVRWLSRQAKIHILDVSDPHGNEDVGDEESATAVKPGKAKKKRRRKSAAAATEQTTEVTVDAATAETATTETATTETAATETATAEAATAETAATEAASPVAETEASETPSDETQPASTEAPAALETPPPGTETAESDLAAKPVAETSSTESAAVETDPVETPTADDVPASPTSDATETVAEPVATTPPIVSQEAAAEKTDGETGLAEETAPAAEATPAAETATPPVETRATATEKKAPAKPPKKKKVSPRQRRRRWLVSTLKPLAGKRMPAAKLSAFQVVMLGRALRSQVAQCAFDYDAAQLVAEMQKAASNLNHNLGDRIAAIVLENEAALRDAAEGAWWDEIQEQASARLVSIAADNLNRQMNRGGVDAQVVMSIDAIGPRTAATSIVAADGRVLHNEDIPCQLSAAMRTLAVTKMGELIHQHHVDLIVISNGPARRACMIAVGELIKQSAEKTVRWTLAERSGADAYAGSTAGDQEMKSTPRRFRSAAWIAFSTLQPSQAMVKVDPLKLRLGSFQRELSDQAVLDALEDVLVSGAARGGVDVNSTTASWLERLPGMTKTTAEKIDSERREKLIASREDLLARAAWASPIHTRQALPFLRVFGSEEALDATLIHPDDYPLAKRLAKSLELELPPASPPGYELPDYSDPKPEPVVTIVSDTTSEPSEEDSKAFGPVDDAPPAESATQTPTEPSDEASESAESTDADVVAAPEAASEETATEAVVVADASADELDSETTPAETSAEESTGDSPVAENEADTRTEASEPAAATPATVETFKQTKPERSKVEKLIKEWQVGTRRSLQIVTWLCEPFGDGGISGPAPAVMNTMPTLSDLKEGDQVIGVVVGVMPFGVFVELTPECSGLIHVSRISDGFVEDLHEAVQVGDVVTAWVTGIDGKRRRVGLSAISPEQEAEMQTQRQESRAPRGQIRGGGDRGPRQGAAGGGNRDAAASGNAGGGRSQGAATGGGARGERSQGNAGPRSGGRDSGNRSGGGRDGGRGRAGGGGGRDQQRGGGRGPRQPEVYEVVGKEPDSAPLTDAMQKGKEPLRSFGDLMQLFSTDKPKPAEKKPAAKKTAEPKPIEEPKTETIAEAPATDAPAIVPPAAPATPESESPVIATPVAESPSTPATETPATETPASETPATETTPSAEDKN